jgi:hypothetical protein
VLLHAHRFAFLLIFPVIMRKATVTTHPIDCHGTAAGEKTKFAWMAFLFLPYMHHLEVVMHHHL